METRELVADIKARPEYYGPEIVRIAEQWERAQARLTMAKEDLAALTRWVQGGRS